ncbi:MAG: hypothetical protein CMJ58_13670 [Planctomycetaceae bacterium]|nr:hypothetical protein [Planctomycetaceae bacterium]
MATAVLPSEYNTLDEGEPLEIELKQPWLAALLAWLVPGLGHLYQGRTGKGLLFFVCIMGAFWYGMYLGGGHVVYASTPEQDLRWQYYCQLGAGGVALPALVQRSRVMDDKPPFGQPAVEPGKLTDDERPWYAPPRNDQVQTTDDSDNISRQPNELSRWIVDHNPHFEIGTVYTMIAGLLNLLVVCDAYAGPLVIRSKDHPEGDSSQDNS